MICCPACQSSACRRSRRRGLSDFAYGLIGLIPWRCTKCEKRFRTRPLPLSDWRYAHCAICGNLDLQRISAEFVPGTIGTIGRLLGLPSLRCEPCRNKFFSIRPLKNLANAGHDHVEDRQRVA